MCSHGTSRTLLLPTPDHTDPDGLRYKLRLWPVDACIADIVQALNAGGVTTLGACCGHGRGAGVIDLADGRVLVITSHAAAHDGSALRQLPHAQPMSWDERRAEYGRERGVAGAMSNPDPTTDPTLITSHRRATVRYTEDVGQPGCLYAWITLPDGRKTSVTERLLRVACCDDEKPYPNDEDKVDIRRSFQAAVVARIDQELDREHGSWAEVHH